MLKLIGAWVSIGGVIDMIKPIDIVDRDAQARAKPNVFASGLDCASLMIMLAITLTSSATPISLTVFIVFTVRSLSCEKMATRSISV